MGVSNTAWHWVGGCGGGGGGSRVCVLSHVQLCVTPWTAAHQAPLSMGFSRQEYGSGLSFPTPRDLSNPGIKSESPVSPALQADSLSMSQLGSLILRFRKQAPWVSNLTLWIQTYIYTQRFTYFTNSLVSTFPLLFLKLLRKQGGKKSVFMPPRALIPTLKSR